MAISKAKAQLNMLATNLYEVMTVNVKPLTFVISKISCLYSDGNNIKEKEKGLG
jgi:hypothetical protein